MFEQSILFFVDDRFTLANGDVKLFCKRLKADAVNQSAFQQSSVSLIMNMFIYEKCNL